MKAVEKTVGFIIERIERRGKNILFYLKHLGRSDNISYILLVHQKMTGHLLVGKWQINGKKLTPLEPQTFIQKVNGYIHFILKLDNGWMIGLSDLRKFAKVVFGEATVIEQSKELKQLGPDVLDVGLEEFIKRVGSRNKTIYQVLMDQSVISGIGNIYASDVLWEAQIHPFQSAKKISKKELEALWLAAKKILKLALKLRGTSTSDYRDTAGEPGGYGEVRYVYDREGMPCFRCGAKIKRIKRAGRSSYFCSKCQK